ncbi:MAG: T9SS type A sorting domain-containing protein [Bacteroidota bacterium]
MFPFSNVTSVISVAVVCWLSFLPSYQLIAQSFELTLGGDENETIAKIVSDGKDLYIIGNSNSYSAPTYKCLITKIRPDGTVLWAKVLGLNNVNRILSRGGWWDPQSNQLIGTFMMEQDANPTIDDFMWASVDSQGHLISTHFRGEEGDDHPFSISGDSMGNTLAVGWTRRPGFEDANMVLYSSSGSVVMAKSFSLSGTTAQGIYRTWAKGDAFMLLGRASNAGGAMNSEDPFLAKMDATGNIIWNQVYKTNSTYPHSKMAIPTPDGGTLIYDQIDSLNISNLLLIKVDSLGTVSWSKEYAHSASMSCSNLSAYATIPDKGAAEKGFLLVGRIDDGVDTDALLINLDEEGNLRSAKTFGGQLNDYFRDLVLLDDSVYAVGSSASFSSDGNVDWYVVKEPVKHDTITDCGSPIEVAVSEINIFGFPLTPNIRDWGVDVPYAVNAAEVSSSLASSINTCRTVGFEQLPSPVLTLHPNPAPGAFILSSPEAAIQSIELYDLTGRRLPAEIRLERNEAEVSSRYRGIALVRVQTDRGVWTQKVVME